MRIKVEQYETGWRADAVELPGTPPVGVGHTPAEAIGALFLNISSEQLERLGVSIEVYDRRANAGGTQ